MQLPFDTKNIRFDLIAGITVGIMLIPQGMAYALLAGLPPIYGLYAAIVPLLVYPFFASSQHLAFGTTAIDALIVAVALSAIAEKGSESYIALAFVLALMVGIIHLTFGLARLGFIVSLLSRPVIVGFTSAAALIIAFSQLKTLLGIQVPQSQYVYEMIWLDILHLNETNLFTIAIGIGACLVLMGLKKWLPKLPAPLFVVVLGIVAVSAFELDKAGVAIIGEVPAGLPSFSLPFADFSTIKTLLPTAFALAFIQFANVYALAKVFSNKYSYPINPDKEWVAMGVANITGSFFQSFPVSGSYSRSAVAEQAGGKTMWSNFYAALFIMLTLLFLTPYFYYLPKAVLAAIIIVAAFGMVDVEGFKTLFAIKRADGAIGLLTFVLTLILGLEAAILSGIGASVILIMFRIGRPHIEELGHLEGTRSFRTLNNHSEAQIIDGILILRSNASFTFMNADYIKDEILKRTENKNLHSVIIDASTLNDIDTTALQAIQRTFELLKERNIGLYFGGTNHKVFELFERSGFIKQIGNHHFHLTPHRALVYILEQHSPELLEKYIATIDPKEVFIYDSPNRKDD